MTTRLRQWLFRRSEQRFISPPMSAYLLIERHRAGIDEEMAAHPEMCEPLLSKPTRHITRSIWQDATMPVWDDEARTWTMETAVVRK